MKRASMEKAVRLFSKDRDSPRTAWFCWPVSTRNIPSVRWFWIPAAASSDDRIRSIRVIRSSMSRISWATEISVTTSPSSIGPDRLSRLSRNPAMVTRDCRPPRDRVRGLPISRPVRPAWVREMNTPEDPVMMADRSWFSVPSGRSLKWVSENGSTPRRVMTRSSSSRTVTCLEITGADR
jgi:hypothetical protein